MFASSGSVSVDSLVGSAQKTESTTESVHRLHGARPGAGNALAVSDSMEAMLANATAWQRGTMEYRARRR